MRHKLGILTIAGVLAWNLTAMAQTNVPPAESPAVTPSAPAATPAPDATATTNLAPAAAEMPAAAAPVAAEPANSNTNAAVPEATPPAPIAAPEPLQPGVVIPLIVMDDVPLTDAIRNLARQATLNYMLDPRIGFGQPGPDGKAIPQPSVSLRWENVSAEQALAALLNNYGLQMVEDSKTKIARLTVKDPAAPEPLVTDVVQLKYASPSNVLESVRSTFVDKRSKVMPDFRTTKLVLVATEKELEAVHRLIDSLDTATRQVLIEARMVETLMNPSTTKGIDWSGTLQAQNVTFGNGTVSPSGSSSTTTMPGTPTTTTLPSGRTITTTASSSVNTVLNSILGNGGVGLTTAGGFSPATGFLTADGVHAVLSFLNTYAETKVISSPRTVTLDNETAEIEVGTLFPIVNTAAGTVQTSGGSQVTYSNLTVRLEVTPQISANNLVNLRVRPQIMRLGDQVRSTVGGVVNIVYSFNKRELKTSVLIPSGNTLVMGGLIEDNMQKSNIKVPILGDIPGLGLLFRSDSKSRQKSNLIIFITPTIVQDTDFQPTKSDFLKTPVPLKDSVDEDWSAWDSGKPKSWGHKKPHKDEFEDPNTLISTNGVARQ